MTSTALCIYAGSVVCAETANADSEETLAGVLTEIDSISKELDQIEETKEELNRRLTSDFSSDLKAIDELHVEIADLELSMEEFLEDDEDDVDDEDHSSDDDASFARHADDYAGEPLTEQEVEDTKANERLCKKIYLKIAKRCHPDRTRVPRFRSLFIQAGTAMAALDVDTLEEIHFKAYGEYYSEKGSRLTLAQKLMNARLRRDLLRRRLEALKLSDDYKMIQTYLIHGYLVASKAYKAALAITKSSLKAQAEALRTAKKAYQSFMV